MTDLTEQWKKTLQALDAAHKAIKMEDETINRLVRSGKQCNYENTKLKTDCKTLAQKLLQVKPELKEWLEVNYGEYL